MVSDSTYLVVCTTLSELCCCVAIHGLVHIYCISATWILLEPLTTTLLLLVGTEKNAHYRW